ncbi:MAG: hypothetical protein J2P41_16040 [Blastocatellia bacterium]|nr:hypothetical protein [Blastocatellia bacterium]
MTYIVRMFTLGWLILPVSRYSLTAGIDETSTFKNLKGDINMTNDELQSPETDAIAAAQVVNEEVEVEVVAAAADADDIVEEAAVPDEVEAEEVAEAADGEEEGE